MNILKKMCINTKYSMIIVEKVFFYEENEISVIKSKGEIWFRGKDIAKALGYSIPRKAIREHIDPEGRSSLESHQASLTKRDLKRTLKNEQKRNFHKRKWLVLYNIAIQARIG